MPGVSCLSHTGFIPTALRNGVKDALINIRTWNHKSTKFLGQAFESGGDTRISVPAARKHDTPVNCSTRFVVNGFNVIIYIYDCDV